MASPSAATSCERAVSGQEPPGGRRGRGRDGAPWRVLPRVLRRFPRHANSLPGCVCAAEEEEPWQRNLDQKVKKSLGLDARPPAMRSARGSAPARGRRRRPRVLLPLLGGPAALLLALAGGAAGQERPRPQGTPGPGGSYLHWPTSAAGLEGVLPPPTEEVEALFAEASAQCRVEFNATGYPEAVVFRNPAKTEVFTDRPARLAATARARAFAEDFAGDFAGDPPNVAVTGWRKRRKGGWRRAYAVVTATGLTYDAAARELRYAVVQFPGQAGVTKGFRRGGEGGAAAEALRFCAGFVDGINWLTGDDYGDDGDYNNL